ncbi:MAG: hypothetical protein KFW21_05930 [Spirochaetota bacterium]|nr:hypothetical protein [Spirochaetota bacterium]
MWSSVNEKITDGTSGLNSNNGPKAIVVGTSSKGSLNKALSIGKKSNVESILGYGEMPNRILDMQKTMADVSIVALPTEGDILGTISTVETIGNTVITAIGTPSYTSDIQITVSNEGTIGTVEVTIASTGDKVHEESVIIPIDGIITRDDLGLSIVFPIDEDLIYTSANSWSFSTIAPTSSLKVLEAVITQALEIYTPEFVFIAQSVNGEFVKSLGSISERLFEDHKPVLFLTETDLDITRSLEEAIADKKTEFAKIDARFVSVVCQPGYIITSVGKVKRSVAGLCAGHLTKSNVNQSIGATNNFAIYDFELLDNWNNTHSRSLDESRLITLRTYAGLNNLFWTNGRTLASDKSDYRFIEIVRTVFKAIKLSRRAALPYIQSNGDSIGLQNLLTEVRSAIDTMVTNTPKELDDFEIDLPTDQDVVNNGVLLNIELFGIPIIRTINLNFMFKYNQSN